MNDAVKHIRTKFWFIRESTRTFDMRKVHTFWQLADIGTKIHSATTWLRLNKAIKNFDPSIDYSKLTPDDETYWLAEAADYWDGTYNDEDFQDPHRIRPQTNSVFFEVQPWNPNSLFWCLFVSVFFQIGG